MLRPMFIRSLFPLLLLSFKLVDAIPWNGPRPTESVPLGRGWSPLPTGVAANPWNIFRRAGQYPLYVCGFIGGDVALPATCSSGSTCVWWSDLSAIGCCTTSGSSCTYPTACLDGGSPSRTPDGNDPLTMTCANSQGGKECYTNSYPLGYTEVGCGYKSWATTVLTDGAKDVSVFVTFKAANHNSDTFSPSSNPSSSPPSNPSSKSPSNPSSSPSSSPSASQSSNPSSSPPSHPSSSSPSNPSQSVISTIRQSGSTGSGTTIVALQASSFISSDSAGQATTIPTTVYITEVASSSDNPPSGSRTGDPSLAGAGTNPTATGGTSGGSSSNIGAIAGGTVGGVVVAALAAGLCAWCVVRRHRGKRGSTPAKAAWAQSPNSAKEYEKHDNLQGRAELPAESSPAPTYASELDGNRASELYGRQLYKPYRPVPPEELQP